MHNPRRHDQQTVIKLVPEFSKPNKKCPPKREKGKEGEGREGKEKRKGNGGGREKRKKEKERGKKNGCGNH